MQVIESDQDSQPGVKLRLTTKVPSLALQTAPATQQDASERPAAETDFYVERIEGSKIGESPSLLRHCIKLASRVPTVLCASAEHGLKAYTLSFGAGSIKQALQAWTASSSQRYTAVCNALDVRAERTS